MNYIVLDLEWNQCPSGKAESLQRLPFEIIEVGAVKLDENLNVAERFDGLVKPQVYDSIHAIIEEITKFSMEELNSKGRYFEEVIKDFLKWCGEDFLFCTWGPQDLSELQRNMKFYNLSYRFGLPFYYLDIQKLFSIRYEDGKVRRSLEHAVEFLKIEKKEEFHRAIDDVDYTTRIMQMMKFDGIEKNYSIDLFHKPANKKEEIYAVYQNYAKYVSRLFMTKDKALADKEVRSARCYLCEQEKREAVKNVKKIANWFSDNSKTYYFLGECPQHGFLKGKIKMKKAEDDRVYVVKTLKLTDAEEAAGILEKQLAIRERRRRKRLNNPEEI